MNYVEAHESLEDRKRDAAASLVNLIPRIYDKPRERTVIRDQYPAMMGYPVPVTIPDAKDDRIARLKAELAQANIAVIELGNNWYAARDALASLQSKYDLVASALEIVQQENRELR